ncbi:hypothetical protein ACFE04_018308 [Oxalis oulophora]
MANPEVPVGVFNHPAGGVATFLFKKNLTLTDVRSGLVLVKNARDFFNRMSEEIKKQMVQSILTVNVHVPNNHTFAVILCTYSTNTTKIAQGHWLDGVANYFPCGAGDEIECWAVFYQNEPEDHNKIRLLIRKVPDLVPVPAA